MPEYKTFTLRFTRNSDLLNTPETFRFRETILQSAIRRHLMLGESLQLLLSRFDLNGVSAEMMEVLGEKALTQGHIDLLLKRRVPIGTSPKIPIEVKTKKAQAKDLIQLRCYMDELLDECHIGILIAADFSKDVIRDAPKKGIHLVRYVLNSELNQACSFEEIYAGLVLRPIGV